MREWKIARCTHASFFSSSARLSRAFRLSALLELEAAVEVFNLTNRRNVLTRNANFGSGSYPANPLPAFGDVTAVGDPKVGAAGDAAEVLSEARMLLG